MNTEEMKGIIDRAEKELDECFQLLMCIKHGKFENIDPFLQFQPKLADCMYELMQQYKKIIAAERETISQKKNFATDDFTEKMRGFAQGKEAIKKAMETGKAMGDGFAWFFYRNSPEELEKHYEHEKNTMFVTGVGGRGEIEFIRKTQKMDGFFVLYHSITNMLRVGDFSLCSVDGHVIGLGELKSRLVNDHFNITAYVTSKVKISNQNGKKKDNDTNGEVNPSPQRLERQLKGQEKLLTRRAEDTKKEDRKIGYQYGLIEEALDSPECLSINADNSMIVLAIRQEGSLWNVLTTEYEPVRDNEEEIVQMVQKTVIDNSEYNVIQYQQIDLDMLPFRKPILWWELHDDIIQGILFHKIAVLTIYNIGHFYEKLKAQGYTVEKCNNAQANKITFKVTKKLDRGILQLEAVQMLLDLIVHDFIPQDEIVNCIEMSVPQILGLGENNVKMNFRLHQNLFGNPREGKDENLTSTPSAAKP